MTIKWLEQLIEVPRILGRTRIVEIELTDFRSAIGQLFPKKCSHWLILVTDESTSRTRNGYFLNVSERLKNPYNDSIEGYVIFSYFLG